VGEEPVHPRPPLEPRQHDVGQGNAAGGGDHGAAGFPGPPTPPPPPAGLPASRARVQTLSKLFARFQKRTAMLPLYDNSTHLNRQIHAPHTRPRSRAKDVDLPEPPFSLPHPPAHPRTHPRPRAKDGRAGADRWRPIAVKAPSALRWCAGAWRVPSPAFLRALRWCCTRDLGLSSPWPATGYLCRRSPGQHPPPVGCRQRRSSPWWPPPGRPPWSPARRSLHRVPRAITSRRHDVVAPSSIR
jgi:hypothetical protein